MKILQKIKMCLRHAVWFDINIKLRLIFLVKKNLRLLSKKSLKSRKSTFLEFHLMSWNAFDSFWDMICSQEENISSISVTFFLHCFFPKMIQPISPGNDTPCKNLNTVFRALYNYRTDNNKRMVCATRKQKRAADKIQKYDEINEISSAFDCLSPDQQISSLCAILERLGSLWIIFQFE